MGYYYETDGVTQLPIRGGDKCAGLILVKNDYEERGSIYKTNEVWYPRGLPFFGIYNQYGILEDIEIDVNFKILFNGIKKDWVTYKARGEWEKDVRSKDLNLNKIDVLFDILHQDDAKIYDGKSAQEELTFDKVMSGKNIKIKFKEDRKTYGLTTMYVHEKIYQLMVNHSGYEVAEEKFKEWYQSRLNNQHAKNSKTSKKNASLYYFLSKLDNFRNLNFNLDLPFRNGFNYYCEFLKQAAAQDKPYSDKEVQTVINGLCQYLAFDCSMRQARRFYSPQAGKGSQEDNTSIFKKLADASLEICQEIDAKP